MINERVGLGMSVNYAHPVGKALAVFALLAILSLPVLGSWLVAAELTPIRLEVTQDALTVSQLGTVYTVDRDAVEQVQLLESLPDNSRIWGTGTPNFLQGSFTVDGLGACKLCLDPTSPPFLLVQTTNGTYLINGTGLDAAFIALQP